MCTFTNIFQVYTRLNKLGICVSHESSNKIFRKLVEKYDQVRDWKAEGKFPIYQLPERSYSPAITFQVPATIADKLLGVVSRYIIVHCNKYVEKHQRVVQKSTCAHLKLTGKHAFG